MKLKLTDEMHLEVILMQSRIVTIGQEFGYHANKSFNSLPTTYKDELESYKVKLENFYSDTDLKEQLNKWFIHISGASRAMRIWLYRKHRLTLQQREKLKIWNLLTLLEMILDIASEDMGRYVTMGLRLDPDNPDTLDRN